MKSEKYAIFLIGPPGSGKSTLASFVKDKLDLKHISAGQLLRTLVENSNAPDALAVKDRIENGLGANDETIFKLYEESIKGCDKSLIFDGNPGGKPQALNTVELLNKYGYNNIVTVTLECTHESSLHRVKQRTGRNDFSEAIWKIRYNWYNTYVKDGFEELAKFASESLTINTEAPLDVTEKKIAELLTAIL